MGSIIMMSSLLVLVVMGLSVAQVSSAPVANNAAAARVGSSPSQRHLNLNFGASLGVPGAGVGVGWNSFGGPTLSLGIGGGHGFGGFGGPAFGGFGGYPGFGGHGFGGHGFGGHGFC